ncbi:MAG: hypothetical protein R2909_19785 [Gemmatimonadales bacterium]
MTGPTFSIAIEPPLIVVTLSGPFRLDDWLGVMRAMPDTPGFEPGLHTLVDGRQAHFDFMFDDAKRLNEVVSRHLDEKRGRGFRSAWVVGADVDFGVARMVQTVLEDLPLEARTFRSIDDARRWLLEPRG